MTMDEILELFESDAFDNDVHCKVDYVLAKTDFAYTADELLEIYDNERRRGVDANPER
ncbi:MAG: hypothetical protein OEY58_19585 [Gammaproteobacteria bacterium]|nr:hypothetical protein [Gammaproteobacteria bacterium]